MFRTKLEKNKSPVDRCADFLRNSFGTVWFLVINAIVFAVWIIINSGFIPNLPVFDPYPYGLLTTAVSLEAIFLSVIVLISQNRASQIDDLREEIDLQINIKAEHEVTRIINMLDEIHDHLGLPIEDDKELKRMKEKTNINTIQNEVMRENRK
ncbi:MAG: hypothetical protein A2563_03850 [Candidatus Magasanikbacteria bacterium RIFOXYD1_FULL_40_23]|uniref:DUF1003 domain-containing protein n=1 Tax=Candidatus Magasanikbacteria bacterium RIFOXYD1_FULL_40_23 TaxID=1798705 RepID=A0A1F6P9B4_9BACT|nr:MAG: hypothetical protein A2563_03850 [Candidatus Magasanikbacteria bacterium RIFOXYD1_FULL_40_23]